MAGFILTPHFIDHFPKEGLIHARSHEIGDEIGQVSIKSQEHAVRPFETRVDPTVSLSEWSLQPSDASNSPASGSELRVAARVEPLSQGSVEGEQMPFPRVHERLSSVETFAQKPTLLLTRLAVPKGRNGITDRADAMLEELVA